VQFDYDPVGAGIDRECRDEAKIVLADLKHWRMPSAAWREVAGLVDELAAAMASDDQATVKRVTVGLELFSDERVGKVGDPVNGPPPKTVMDLAAQLVHSLDEDGEADNAHGKDEKPKRR
jgi:hypothetical protein